MKVRTWVYQVETIPPQQSLQSAVGSLLHDFDRKLSDLEAKALARDVIATMSLLHLMEFIRYESRHVQQLGIIIGSLPIKEHTRGPFDFLDMIYESTCANNLVGT